MGNVPVTDLFRTVDLTGVLANAVLGGVIARRARLDPVGFLVLAVLSGLGGGILRDTLLQHGTPVALTDYAYMLTAFAGAALAFIVRIEGRWWDRAWPVVDALALGCWAAAGAQKLVKAECQASDSPKEPEFTLFDRFPPTSNNTAATARVRNAFDSLFGDRATELPLQTASEDFSDIPTALSIPYTYWGIGGIDPETYRQAEAAGRVAQDIPVNHSPSFAPVIQPTLDAGTQALVVAALAWIA